MDGKQEPAHFDTVLAVPFAAIASSAARCSGIRSNMWLSISSSYSDTLTHAACFIIGHHCCKCVLNLYFYIIIKALPFIEQQEPTSAPMDVIPFTATSCKQYMIDCTGSVKLTWEEPDCWLAMGAQMRWNTPERRKLAKVKLDGSDQNRCMESLAMPTGLRTTRHKNTSCCTSFMSKYHANQ